MVRFFLKAKHWQLFLLMFVIPFALQLFLMFGMILEATGNFSGNPPQDPLIMMEYFKWFPLLMVLYIGFHYGWFWSVAVGLQPMISETIRPNIRKFKILMIIPVVYLLLLLTGMGLFFATFNPQNFEVIDPNPVFILIGFLIFIPLHLFSVFCIFYSIYFVAKTFKTAELQKPLQFSDFAGEFFLLWFYMVGIWILQPKINQMALEMEQQNQP